MEEEKQNTGKNLHEKGSNKVDRKNLETEMEESEDLPNKMITELLSDDVSAAILDRLGEPGGCGIEDMMDIDAVNKVTDFILEGLEHFGLVNIEGDIMTLTEKGKKVLKHLEELEGELD